MCKVSANSVRRKAPDDFDELERLTVTDSETPIHLGVEIGGTKIQVVIGDATGRILDRRRFEVKRALGAQGIRESIAKAAREFREARPIRSAGVGFGGPIDVQNGTIRVSHQIDGWDGFPLRQWLSDLLGVPVAVDNDANLAALAEARVGAGRDRNAVFYITLGSGVGGGFVQNGRLFHGARVTESEIGHLRGPENDGVVEDYCSGWAVNARMRCVAESQPQSWIAAHIPKFPGAEAKALSRGLKENDPGCATILGEAGDRLAWAISMVTHLLSPEIVVIGGGLSQIGAPLIDVITRRLPEYLMESLKPGPSVQLAELGDNVVPIGALLIAP